MKAILSISLIATAVVAAIMMMMIAGDDSARFEEANCLSSSGEAGRIGTQRSEPPAAAGRVIRSPPRFLPETGGQVDNEKLAFSRLSLLFSSRCFSCISWVGEAVV